MGGEIRKFLKLLPFFAFRPKNFSILEGKISPSFAGSASVYLFCLHDSTKYNIIILELRVNPQFFLLYENVAFCNNIDILKRNKFIIDAKNSIQLPYVLSST